MSVLLSNRILSWYEMQKASGYKTCLRGMISGCSVAWKIPSEEFHQQHVCFLLEVRKWWVLHLFDNNPVELIVACNKVAIIPGDVPIACQCWFLLLLCLVNYLVVFLSKTVCLLWLIAFVVGGFEIWKIFSLCVAVVFLCCSWLRFVARILVCCRCSLLFFWQGSCCMQSRWTYFCDAFSVQQIASKSLQVKWWKRLKQEQRKCADDGHR